MEFLLKERQLVWHWKLKSKIHSFFFLFLSFLWRPFHLLHRKGNIDTFTSSHLICNIRSSGFSMNRFHSLQNLATVAPSRTLWSAPMLTWANQRGRLVMSNIDRLYIVIVRYLFWIVCLPSWSMQGTHPHHRQSVEPFDSADCDDRYFGQVEQRRTEFSTNGSNIA